MLSKSRTNLHILILWGQIEKKQKSKDPMHKNAKMAMGAHGSKLLVVVDPEHDFSGYDDESHDEARDRR